MIFESTIDESESEFEREVDLTLVFLMIERERKWAYAHMPIVHQVRRVSTAGPAQMTHYTRHKLTFDLHVLQLYCT
jgi:hypothetical protein